MKKSAINIGIIASVLPHMFCCVLPIALSVAGLVAPEFAHTQIVQEWVEPWMFVFSALMMGLSWVLVIRDCRCHCGHCHGESNHRFQKIILGIVTILFIVSVTIHIVAHH
ncbi:MAG: hypothetical protein IJ560_00465 [Alphaproteobacteria bacterium]|nr:hypothetical protein [Alphaproteobacteria bacterium]